MTFDVAIVRAATRSLWMKTMEQNLERKLGTGLRNILEGHRAWKVQVLVGQSHPGEARAAGSVAPCHFPLHFWGKKEK